MRQSKDRKLALLLTLAVTDIPRSVAMIPRVSEERLIRLLYLLCRFITMADKTQGADDATISTSAMAASST